MKAYTDISQSKKLAKILPLKSADGTWKRVAIAGAHLGVPEELQYLHDGDMPFVFYSGVGIPSWSLATLLNYIKDKCGYFELVYLSSTFDGRANKLENVHRLSTDMYDIYENELVDACYEMILKLNELKLL